MKTASASLTRSMSPRFETRELSVVMPVHNALPHLDEAISSILNQTYRDFEFVILDDASTDGSTARLLEWSEVDQRIRLVQSRRQLGPAVSSNEVVNQSTGALVARMDADDISLPDRLHRQVEILKRNPKAGLVGTLSEGIDVHGRVLHEPYFNPSMARRTDQPFQHGSIMFRRNIFESIGGYRAACEFWEDQDFLLRAATAAEVLIIPQLLYRYRHSSISTRLVSDRTRVELALNAKLRWADAVARGDPFDPSLAPHADSNELIDPRVFVELGSLILWSGGHPRLFRRLINRGRLRLDGKTLKALIWTACGSLIPSLLLWIHKERNRLRRFGAVPLTKALKPVVWHPPRD